MANMTTDITNRLDRWVLNLLLDMPGEGVLLQLLLTRAQEETVLEIDYGSGSPGRLYSY